MWIDKIKKPLLELYPELARLNAFSHLTAEITNLIDPRLKKPLRYGLPVCILLIVLWLGISIGTIIARGIGYSPFTPPEIDPVSPTPINEFVSHLRPLQKAIGDFNPTLPDPIPPSLDYNLTLEPVQN